PAVDEHRVRALGGEEEGAHQALPVVAHRGFPRHGQAHVLELLAHVGEVGVDDLARQHLVAGADDLDSHGPPWGLRPRGSYTRAILTCGGGGADDERMTTLERAEAAEHALSQELDKIAVKSVIYTSGERDPREPMPRPDAKGRRFLMGHDARPAQRADTRTVIDFYRLRFGPSMHMLQSARLALKSGAPEKVVVACLLHDIAITGFIRSDHGYWAAQLVEPYVDEEVSWAIRYHQALRFYPDESVGYQYPELYKTLFGEDYQPEPHIARAYQDARTNKWYMTPRLITVNDLYSFDPNVTVQLEEFTDVIGRNFKQPKEGLGFDASPSAHIWRTLMCPTKNPQAVCPARGHD